MMISRYEGVKDQELACLMGTRQRGEDFLLDTSPQVEMCVCVHLCRPSPVILRSLRALI